MAGDDVYDVFLCHPHTHADWVEQIAARLDDVGINPWLDRWVLIPGEDYQPEMAKGLDEAKTCAVFVGAETPTGWTKQEMQKALDRQAGDSSFRVIPVLMADGKAESVEGFLGQRTWVDFRKGDAFGFDRLVKGIRGERPGRFKEPAAGDGDPVIKKLEYLASLEQKAGGLGVGTVVAKLREETIRMALQEIAGA